MPTLPPRFPRAHRWALLAVTSAFACNGGPIPLAASADDDYSTVELEHLRLRTGASLEHRGDPLRPGPGQYRVGLDNARRVHIGAYGDPPESCFEPIDTPEAALEFVRLRFWGLEIETEAHWERVIACYDDAGYELAAPTAGFQECTRFEAEPKFGTIAREVDGGFEVTLTLLDLPPGMGAGAEIRRQRVRVLAYHQLETLERELYVLGPTLNWQTASFDLADFGEAVEIDDDTKTGERPSTDDGDDRTRRLTDWMQRIRGLDLPTLPFEPPPDE